MQPPLVDRQLVYLVYGANSACRHEAKFSILTALREAKGDLPRILLYTDDPAAFTGWPVDVVVLDADKLRVWTGTDGYLHRRKAEAINAALGLAESSIFIDTDTFFLQSPLRLFSRLASNSWLVDEIEGRWGGAAGTPIHQLLEGYLAGCQGVSDDLLLINSGVLGLQHGAMPMMERSIALIDELYPLAPKVHTIEQFAVGLSAYNFPKPAESKGVIKHYYGEKAYWRAMLQCFFGLYGETFHVHMPELTREVPVVRPKPLLIRRLWMRLIALAWTDKRRKEAKLLFSAANLPVTPYARACLPVYCERLIRKAPGLAAALNSGKWPEELNSLAARDGKVSVMGVLRGMLREDVG